MMKSCNPAGPELSKPAPEWMLDEHQEIQSLNVDWYLTSLRMIATVSYRRNLLKVDCGLFSTPHEGQARLHMISLCHGLRVFANLSGTLANASGEEVTHEEANQSLRLPVLVIVQSVYVDVHPSFNNKTPRHVTG
jgi:hypothetical protein